MSSGPPAPAGDRVCRPETSDEAAALLRQARAKALTVVPTGRGTKASWLPPALDSCRLDTGGLSHPGELRPENLTARFAAGTSLTEAARQLAAAGLWLPLNDLDSGGEASLGGLLATGLVNPLRLGFGLPRDWVLGLTVLDGEGRLLRLGAELVKNVAGYDLVHLHLGAWGQLGLIVEAALRLLPLPEADAALTAVYSSAEDAEMALRAALRGRSRPASLEAEVHPAGVRVLARILGDRAGLSARLDDLAGDLRSAGPLETLEGAEAAASWREYEAGWRAAAAGDLWRCRLSLPAPGLTHACSLAGAALGGQAAGSILAGQAGSGVYRLFWRDQRGPLPVLDALSAAIEQGADPAAAVAGPAAAGFVVAEGPAARWLASRQECEAGWVSFPPRRRRSQDALEQRVLEALAPGGVFNPHLHGGARTP